MPWFFNKVGWSMQVQELSPSDIVIFGGTGDLSQRKILPALYYRLHEGQLPAESRIIVLGRASRSEEELQSFLLDACRTFIPDKDFDDAAFSMLASCVHYHCLSADKLEDFKALKAVLEQGANPVRVFYLATPADIYGSICQNLADSGLRTPDTRVVLEKPIGYGKQSFREINHTVLEHFDEKQVYRIDHYLGKETVQNLMVLRFTNNVFHEVWNGRMVDHVQITVAESTGLENRHAYYDDAGALRDMVQNHLIQLLCLVAMEPPNIVTADAIRDEKLKVLRALRPLDNRSVTKETVRGQYGAGTIGTRKMESYLQEIKKDTSNTETFVAIKAHVDNWRWANVPFYMRTGKSLSSRYSEIVIHFKPVAHTVFPNQAPDMANKLVIRLQPNEYIQFQMMTKVPGPGGYRFKPVNLNLSLSDEFEERYPDAYERLLMDVVRGNQTLFMRSDEVEAAWNWVETILESWKASSMGVEVYAAGTDGPRSVHHLMEKDGREWHPH
jgi:glucose-6-phosphate 1-dehydrogenase